MTAVTRATCEIAVVDDLELIGETLRIALAGRGIDATFLRARRLDELLDELLALAPRVLLLDLDLGEHGDSTTIIGRLADAGIRIVAVTGVEDMMRIAAALEAGAFSFARKADGFDALVAAAEAASRSDVPPDLEERYVLLAELRAWRAARQRALAPFGQLTRREQATLRAMADGLTVREIASEWVVSELTVRTHVRGILTKLDVRSQLGAVAAAMRVGWLAHPSDALTPLRAARRP